MSAPVSSAGSEQGFSQGSLADRSGCEVPVMNDLRQQGPKAPDEKYALGRQAAAVTGLIPAGLAA